MLEQEERSHIYHTACCKTSVHQVIFEQLHGLKAVAAAVHRAAERSPCLCREDRWWHLSAGIPSSHTSWPACLWWVGHYVWGLERHCHQAGRRSSSPLPPLAYPHLHHPALETGDSICRSASQMRKSQKNLDPNCKICHLEEYFLLSICASVIRKL